MDLQQLTTFLGWCTLINLVVLSFATIMIWLARDWAMNIHSRMFDIDKAELPTMYFDFLSRYKLLWYIFNLAPWLALKIMTWA